MSLSVHPPSLCTPHPASQSIGMEAPSAGIGEIALSAADLELLGVPAAPQRWLDPAHVTAAKQSLEEAQQGLVSWEKAEAAASAAIGSGYDAAQRAQVALASASSTAHPS